MPYAEIDDDLSIYYWSKGEGMPIVFIHPFVMGHNVFMHQEQLAKSYRTIFYDLAGHGKSSKGEQPITIGLLADHLKILLDGLGIEKAVICAYSHGGLVAQEFALKYPDQVIAMILSGGYSELNNFSPIFFIKSVMYMAKFRQIPLAAKLQAKLNHYYPEDEKKIYELAKKTDPQRAYEFCRNGLDYKSTYSIHRMKMPILLIFGTLEKPMHHYQIPFLKAAPQTEVIYIDKGTHQVPIGSFQAFNGAVHQYLKPINEQYLQEQRRNGGGQ